ncbi:M20/M25/M40 family metallo-hydrolase [Sporolituus thermophilus]|uniref:Peptidase T-like protein n=1 Tax=Sporolituus thermophilus DSM 23256 TaxID=1123285 RepID=A0A1G7MSI6_9FIRM|nr:M20/M25/M40 family metallo-hydrolase [Sporolituus thermophilus]SDF64616.1 peptidase T-like protein [Sporolituus thermophilus DSM 23256]
MINRERMLAEFFELVKIKCSTRAEREVADLLKARLTALGLEVTEDNVGEKIGGNCGNVFAYLKGSVPTAPVLMLSAHLDCVEPCAGIEPVLKDGIITSAGDTILGSDDKSGVEAIMEALRVLREKQLPHGDIQVVFTVAEEGGLNGSKNMDPAWLKADLGYALDSSGEPGKIIVAAPGQNKINVVIHGKSAHAGLAPEEGVNAIVVAGKALAELKDGRIDEETTANVGNIKGGGATNIVPDRVEITCEARSRNLAKLEAQTEHMVATFERVAAANGARAEVKVTKAYEPYVLSPDAPVVALAKQAAESIGLEPKLTGTGGGSDANFFNSYGVPTAVLGTGMNKVHTTDEFIKEEHLYKTAELVVALIQTAAQMKK